MSFKELLDAIENEAALKGVVMAPATVGEWWINASERRGVITIDDHDRATVTEKGTQSAIEVRKGRIATSVSPARQAAKVAIPGGVIAVAVGVTTLVEKAPAVAVVICTFVVLLVLWLVVAEVVDRASAALVDPWFERKVDQMAVDWLEGREVRFGGPPFRRKLPAQAASVVRLDDGRVQQLVAKTLPKAVAGPKVQPQSKADSGDADVKA